MRRNPAPLVLSLLVTGALFSGVHLHAGSAALGSTAQESVTVDTPDRPVVDLAEVEDLSESVANELLGFSDALRRREFEKASAWIAADFKGNPIVGLIDSRVTELPLGAQRVEADVASAGVVDAAAFLKGFEALLGPWQHVELVLWKVKGAEFQAAASMWGNVRFKVSLLGTGPDGGPRSLDMWARARVSKERGRWVLSRFALESHTSQHRAAPLFRDVSTSAGIAHSGIRFGKAGNRDFAWNGIAAGDANGDGLYDVFVPSRPESFLYVADPDGPGFDEEARDRGLAAQDGGTGAVFFDADGDGDQDLAVAGVGWTEPSGEVAGNPLRLYVNDGSGKFTDEGAKRGFGNRMDSYSLVVFDAENDGLLDVYVTNYGRVEAEPNDSWVDARNGSPDALYVNQGDGRFTDMAAARGIEDTRWSYAAAAADYDEDGDQDVYVANDYGTNAFWNNDGKGSFVDVAAALGVEDLGNGMGCAFGDLNADGLLDLYVVNMSSTAGRRILGRLAAKDDRWAALSKMAAGNSIFLAQADDEGGVSFERLPPANGGIGGSWAWSIALVDLDLDGLLDVYCCNGYVTGDTAADT